MDRIGIINSESVLSVCEKKNDTGSEGGRLRVKREKAKSDDQ